MRSYPSVRMATPGFFGGGGRSRPRLSPASEAGRAESLGDNHSEMREI